MCYLRENEFEFLGKRFFEKSLRDKLCIQRQIYFHLINFDGVWFVEINFRCFEDIFYENLLLTHTQWWKIDFSVRPFHYCFMSL